MLTCHMLRLNGACFLKEWFSALKGHDWLVGSVNLWFLPSLLWLDSWMISSKWDASPFADRPFSCLEVWTPLTTRTDRLQKKTDGLNEWFKWTTTNVIYVKNLNNRQHNLWIKQCLHPMCSRKQDCHLWVNWQNRKTQTQDLPFVHAILFQCRAWLVVGSC